MGNLTVPLSGLPDVLGASSCPSECSLARSHFFACPLKMYAIYIL